MPWLRQSGVPAASARCAGLGPDAPFHGRVRAPTDDPISQIKSHCEVPGGIRRFLGDKLLCMGKVRLFVLLRFPVFVDDWELISWSGVCGP